MPSAAAIIWYLLRKESLPLGSLPRAAKNALISICLDIE
jgi:hypothetical protein